MEFSSEDKKKIEEQIVEIIISSLESNKIKEEDMQPISSYVLNHIDDITTKAQLVDFLKNLASKWPIFGGLQNIQVGEIKEQEEQKAIHSVEQLIESGNLDQALAVAKSATHS